MCVATGEMSGLHSYDPDRFPCCSPYTAGVTQIDRVVEVVEETLKGHAVQLLAKKALPRLDLPKVRRNR